MENLIPHDDLNRLKHKGSSDEQMLEKILDTNRVGTLAFVGDNGFPYQIPIAYVRRGKSILLHGSTGAGALRAVLDGRPVSFGIFRTTALVLARSGFESSMNYESCVIFGRCALVASELKDELATYITERLFPGRTAELRGNTAKELAATAVIELQIEHWNVKISDEGPTDLPADISAPVWAGRLPIEYGFGNPIPADDLDPKYSTLPAYIKDWLA